MSLASLKRKFVPPPPERPDLDSKAWAQFADHVARYLMAGERAQGKRVLDAGTGPGYGAAILSLGGALSVVAVDIDAASIDQARTRYANVGVEFIVDDCEKLEKAQGPFDLICSFENIEHLPHPERFLEAATKRLAPGGTLIISTPDRAAMAPWVNGRPFNPHHTTEWYTQEFLDLLRKYFRRLEHKIQVKSNSLDRRRDATRALVKHLQRSNPLFYLLGVAGVLLRKGYYWEPIYELGTPSPADFPIVDARFAQFLGTSYTNVVICAEPIATT